MENAVEAIKIAGAVLLFVLALSLGISSLSKANSSVTAITNMYDKDTQYTYVEPSSNLTRNVGAETIVTTMYQAYVENIKIYFKKENGEELPLYYKTDSYGKIVTDEKTKKAITVNYIDLTEEGFSSFTAAQDHLSMLLAGKKRWEKQYKDVNREMYELISDNKYGRQFGGSDGTNLLYADGLYSYLSDHTFSESLGEYELDNQSNKKRVITYQLEK